MAPPRRIKKCGVYAIVCNKTGWAYIGGSFDIDDRVRQHTRLLDRGESHNRALQYAWSLLGADNFSVRVLEVCCQNKVGAIEQHWLQTWDGPLFNTLKDARRPREVSLETRELLSQKARDQHAAGTLGRQAWRGND